MTNTTKLNFLLFLIWVIGAILDIVLHTDVNQIVRLICTVYWVVAAYFLGRFDERRNKDKNI